MAITLIKGKMFCLIGLFRQPPINSLPAKPCHSGGVGAYKSESFELKTLPATAFLREPRSEAQGEKQLGFGRERVEREGEGERDRGEGEEGHPNTSPGLCPSSSEFFLLFVPLPLLRPLFPFSASSRRPSNGTSFLPFIAPSLPPLLPYARPVRFGGAPQCLRSGPHDQTVGVIMYTYWV